MADVQMGTLTMEQFVRRLKALLREADDSGLDAFAIWSDVFWEMIKTDFQIK